MPCPKAGTAIASITVTQIELLLPLSTVSFLSSSTAAVPAAVVRVSHPTLQLYLGFAGSLLVSDLWAASLGTVPPEGGATLAGGRVGSPRCATS
jgi:hypothetical protein